MATRQSVEGLLRLIATEVAEGASEATTAELRKLDTLIRNVEGDIERVRQELDELLGAEAMLPTQKELPL